MSVLFLVYLLLKQKEPWVALQNRTLELNITLARRWTRRNKKIRVYIQGTTKRQFSKLFRGSSVDSTLHKTRKSRKRSSNTSQLRFLPPVFFYAGHKVSPLQPLNSLQHQGMSRLLIAKERVPLGHSFTERFSFFSCNCHVFDDTRYRSNDTHKRCTLRHALPYVLFEVLSPIPQLPER